MPRGIDTSRHPARRPDSSWQTYQGNEHWSPTERTLADSVDSWGGWSGNVGTAYMTSLGDRYGARASFRGGHPYGDVEFAEGRSGGYRTQYRAQVVAEGLRSQLGQGN